MKFEELSKIEQEILNQIYGTQFSGGRGYSQNQILYVDELNDEERYLFDKDSLTSANQFVQKLYKISGNLMPLRFNLAVTNLIKNTEEMRMNYCQVDNRTLKVFFEQRQEMPEVVYRNLENTPNIDATLKNIIEADMRQNFDLRHDNLISFAVFHTSDEEYAVLVTTSKLVENSFDMKKFFCEVMNLKPLTSEKKKSEILDVQISESIKNYWSKILKDMPELPLLPYLKVSRAPYKQKAYYFTIPAEIMSDLREKAKSNKMMLMAIFETAWEILLQEVNKSQDVAFATFVPSKNDGNCNVIPVRL